MNKIIFEISEVRKTSASEPELNIEMKFNPMRQNGIAMKLANVIIEAIDGYRRNQYADRDQLPTKL